MNRQIRRAAAREKAKTMQAPVGMDEKQVLMLRLGQKDAQLFVMEMQLNAAHQEMTRLRAELNKFQPVQEGEMTHGSEEGGADLDTTADLPEGKGLQAVGD